MKGICCSLLTVLFFVAFTFSGCITANKNLGSSKLQTKISDLETRMQKLEKGQVQLEKIIVDQISLQEEIADKLEHTKESDIKKGVVKTPSKKDIQIALKNAGFYTGDIDGKIGAKTRNAIMEFQKQNDLKVDGIVGKSTWEALSQFYSVEED